MFKNRQHYERVSDLLGRLAISDPEDNLLALLYLIGANDDLYNHAEALLDFSAKTINTNDWSDSDWLQGSAWQLALLGFNLYTAVGIFPNDAKTSADVMGILNNLEESDYALAMNAIHVRFHKTEFISFTYDPNEKYD